MNNSCIFYTQANVEKPSERSLRVAARVRREFSFMNYYGRGSEKCSLKLGAYIKTEPAAISRARDSYA